MTTVPPEKLPCPECGFEPVFEVHSINRLRVKILCAKCLKTRGIAIKPEVAV